MSDEKFLLEYEKLLDKGYCNCNEMNCIDNDSPRRILRIAKGLQQENQQLKKQLENFYCNRTDCSSRIRNSKQYDSLVQKTENQQKEFIEYLEKEIVDSRTGSGQQYFAQQHLRIYKEIIGEKNE